MGMIYRRKKRDPATGKLEEQGPYWMKYYIEGRPIQESTKVFEKEQAKKILKVKEGEVAAGIYRGPSMDRIRFEDLAALVQQDYQINRRKTVRRITEYQQTTGARRGQWHDQPGNRISQTDVPPRLPTDSPARGSCAPHSPAQRAQHTLRLLRA